MLKKLKPILRPYYGSVYELLMISKWLLLKGAAMGYFGWRTGADRQSAQKKFIAFGNALFAPPIPYDIYESYDRYVSGYQTNPIDLSLYNKATPYNTWLKEKTILDLGGGCGAYSARMLEKGAAKLTLLEIQKRKTDYAAKQYGHLKNFTIVNGSAEAMPFEDASFDTIFSHTVFEHLSDIPKVLAECHRVLKPGGYLMLSYNFFHHYGGSHLFPYIHFPWANWVVDEDVLCDYWSEKMLADCATGWTYYDKTCTATHLGTGSEMNLNKLTFDDFEALLFQTPFKLVKKKASGALVNAFPVLGRLPLVKYPLTGTVFYAIQKKA